MSAKSETVDTDLETALRDISLLEEVVSGWEVESKNTVDALRRSSDALNREAFARIIKKMKENPATFAMLKDLLADETVYAVLRYHGLIKPSLHEKVEHALNTVRPMLSGHGGGVELVSIEAPATAVIRLLGACDNCPASALTLSEGVEKAIREHCPEIQEIKKAPAAGRCEGASTAVTFISPFGRAEDVGWISVGKVESVPEAAVLAVEAKGQSIILTRRGDKIMCYQNACSHLGLPLDMGRVENGILTCPHHGFRFSLESGECLTAAEVQLQTHAVKVSGDRIEVKLK